jgi:lipopolysaccharide export system permease protein
LKAWLHIIDETLAKWSHWLRNVPQLELWGLLLMCALLGCAQAMGYHEGQLPWMPANGSEVPKAWQQPGLWVLMYHYVAPYLKLAAMLGGMVLHLTLLRARADARLWLWPLWVAGVFLAFILVLGDFHDQWQAMLTQNTGQPFPLAAYVGKLVLLAMLCLSPAIALTYYATRPIWERYVLKRFAQPLAFCFIAFGSLWIMSDWLDHAPDYQAHRVPAGRLLTLYINMVPSVLLECSAAALLLATLHGLMGMVRGNELVTLLGCGLGLTRIMRPWLLLCLMVCGLATAANYEWARNGGAERRAVMQAIKQGVGGTIATTSVMHYNSATRRQWFIGVVPFFLREEKLRQVQIRQFGEDGKLQEAWIAATAMWSSNGNWALSKGVRYDYRTPDGTPKIYPFNLAGRPDWYDQKNWPETLWDVLSGMQVAEDMSVVDLVSHLVATRAPLDQVERRRLLAELWHRFSQPWQGMSLVLAAFALMPIHARRGLWTAVGTSLCLFFLLLFLDQSTLQLARSHWGPMVLWFPHALIGLGSLWLLWDRAGRPKRLWDRSLHWPTVWRVLRGRRTLRSRSPGEFFAMNVRTTEQRRRLLSQWRS